MNKKRCWWAILFVVGIGHLGAQNQEETTPLPPSAPYLAALPEEAAWTITFTSKPPAAPAPTPAAAPEHPKTTVLRVDQVQSAPPLEDLMARMEVVKAGSLKKETITWLNGQQSQDWLDGEVFFHQDPATKKYGFRTARDDPYGMKGGTDFPDLSWINSSRFLRMETKGNESCFLYRCTETSQTARGKTGLPSRPTSVWISVKTKLPVAMEDEVKSAAYQFSVPTETSLTLPESCQKFLTVIANYESTIESQRMAPPR